MTGSLPPLPKGLPTVAEALSAPSMRERQKEMTTALRMHAAGVAIVTTETAEGPVGLTINSLASVSVSPRVLMFSFTHHSGAAGAIIAADAFVVHLLKAENAHLALAFGTPSGTRFSADQGWSRLPTGEPFLPSAGYAIRCTPRELHGIGESRVLFADVVDIVECEPGSPLVYCDYVFHTITALDAVPAD